VNTDCHNQTFLSKPDPKDQGTVVQPCSVICKKDKGGGSKQGLQLLSSTQYVSIFTDTWLKEPCSDSDRNEQWGGLSGDKGHGVDLNNPRQQALETAAQTRTARRGLLSLRAVPLLCQELVACDAFSFTSALAQPLTSRFSLEPSESCVSALEQESPSLSRLSVLTAVISDGPRTHSDRESKGHLRVQDSPRSAWLEQQGLGLRPFS
jgi:hypothetical protein